MFPILDQVDWVAESGSANSILMSVFPAELHVSAGINSIQLQNNLICFTPLENRGTKPVFFWTKWSVYISKSSTPRTGFFFTYTGRLSMVLHSNSSPVWVLSDNSTPMVIRGKGGVVVVATKVEFILFFAELYVLAISVLHITGTNNWQAADNVWT